MLRKPKVVQQLRSSNWFSQKTVKDVKVTSWGTDPLTLMTRANGRTAYSGPRHLDPRLSSSLCILFGSQVRDVNELSPTLYALAVPGLQIFINAQGIRKAK